MEPIVIKKDAHGGVTFTPGATTRRAFTDRFGELSWGKTQGLVAYFGAIDSYSPSGHGEYRAQVIVNEGEALPMAYRSDYEGWAPVGTYSVSAITVDGLSPFSSARNPTPNLVMTGAGTVTVGEDSSLQWELVPAYQGGAPVTQGWQWRDAVKDYRSIIAAAVVTGELAPALAWDLASEEAHARFGRSVASDELWALAHQVDGERRAVYSRRKLSLNKVAWDQLPRYRVEWPEALARLVACY